MRTKKLTTLALLTTIALALSAIESLIPPFVPIPGIKLGLANIITLFILLNGSHKDAFLVLLMRILLSSFAFGNAFSAMYSLAGGLFCFVAMCILNRFLKGELIFLTSVIGALFHNIGQILIAYYITKVPGVLLYLPFLIISGILTGIFTGLCTFFLQKYMLPLIRRFQL